MAYDHQGSSNRAPAADINVTPLVDVMLVLVIIFLVTAPLLTHKIRVDLPQPNKNVIPPAHPPAPIKLVIKADGSLTVNGAAVNERGLTLLLKAYALEPKGQEREVQIQASDDVQYNIVAKVLADAKAAGMQKIGFLNTD